MIGNLFGLMADACEIAKRAAISNSVAAKCEAVHADAGARVCGLKSRGIDTQGKKRWSGRRESNPRMQLGKLDVLLSAQAVSCKTSRIRIECDQGVTSAKQNPEFDADATSFAANRDRKSTRLNSSHT